MDASEVSRVKVDTAQLQEVAESTFSKIEQYRSSVQTINKLVNSTANTWKGEAAEAYRSVFEQEYARAMEILDDFMSVPQALCNYAGIYSEAIAAANAAVSGISQFKME